MFGSVVILSFVAMHFNFSSWFRLGTYAVTTNDFLFLIAIIVFLYDVYLGNTTLRFRKNVVIIPFLIFLFFATISGLQPILGEGGKQAVQFVKTYAHLLQIFSLFAMSFFYDDSAHKIKTLMKWWLVIGLISNIYALYSLAARPLGWPGAYIYFDSISDGDRGGHMTEGASQIVLRFGGFYRATSFFSEPSSLAGFNNLTLLFFLLPKIINGKFSFNSKLFNLLFILTWIPSQLFTFSLTAVSLLGITTVSFLYIKGLEFSKKLLPYLGVLVLGLILSDQVQALFTGTSVLELFIQRISSVIFFDTSNFVSGESAFHRFQAYDIAWDIWEANPWVGVGLGLTYMNGMYDVSFMQMTSMAALTETGILGMLSIVSALFLFSGVMLYRAKQMLANRNNYPDWFIPVYIMAAIQSILIAFSNMLLSNHMTNMILWILLSLLVLVFQQERKYSKINYYEIGASNSIRKKLSEGLKKSSIKQ